MTARPGRLEAVEDAGLRGHPFTVPSVRKYGTARPAALAYGTLPRLAIS
ncbi:hypothetical protein [Actinoallomurus iriomotensis]|nr:hypothetical protein [Actinoallomurus iriomotensis]